MDTPEAQDGLAAIVIGGSAGALEPLLAIAGALPAATTAPIVVVIHLHPRYPNMLPALIGSAVRGRPTREAADKEPLRPGTIYVAPPDYHLLVERGGSLSLSIDGPVHFSRPSIDVLFESAADAFGSRLAAVLLSGASADGAHGLARIAAAGGAAIVQADADYTTMPDAGRAAVPSARALDARDIASHLAALSSRERALP
ncbi:MAG TPA: chemotaxis protein CheB [Kofleriaceae bacterium]|nr:chemotaxis protein CheB [Kofleriaceae bacterium]